ncbi:MAG: hypothetical protein J5780_00555 [Treponema sp.]|nr:hypothetical protein [Treponema sp.]
MKLFSLKKNLVLISAACLFFSCRTLQNDVIMSTDAQVQTEEIGYTEKYISFIDAKDIMGTMDKKDLYKECDRLIKNIDDSLQNLGMNKAIAARLYAQKGRLLLIKGKTGEAKKNYNLSLEESKGDSQTLILGSRLGIIKDITDEDVISGSNENGLLILEHAVILYHEGKFAKSAAKFEEAFLHLPEFYANNYGEVRDAAIASKDHDFSTESKATVELLKKPSLTAGQMLLLSQDLSGLLDEITKGKKLSERELFSKAETNRLFEAASGEGEQKITKDSKADRIIGARFLWNLVSDENGKTKYSDFYRKNNLPSPVNDVETYSEDFDAVLGCIEKEIINLEDGESFRPEKEVSGTEFSSWLKKITKKSGNSQ